MGKQNNLTLQNLEQLVQTIEDTPEDQRLKVDIAIYTWGVKNDRILVTPQHVMECVHPPYVQNNLGHFVVIAYGSQELISPVYRHEDVRYKSRYLSPDFHTDEERFKENSKTFSSASTLALATINYLKDKHITPTFNGKPLEEAWISQEGEIPDIVTLMNDFYAKKVDKYLGDAFCVMGAIFLIMIMYLGVNDCAVEQRKKMEAKREAIELKKEQNIATYTEPYQKAIKPVVLTVDEDIYREYVVTEGALEGTLKGSSSGALTFNSGSVEGKVRGHQDVVIVSNYTITGHIEDGKRYSVDVEGTPQELRTLDGLVRQGSRISFPRGNIFLGSGGTYSVLRETDFGEDVDRGTKLASRITVQ